MRVSRGKGAGRASWALLAVVVFGWAGIGRSDEAEDGWSGEVAASFTAQTGTVDTIAGTADAKAERNWTQDTAAVRFSGTYGRTRDRNDNPSDDRTLQNSQALFADYKHIFDDRFFWTANHELSRDPTQDREVRFRLSTGPGYRFWQGGEKKKQFFDVSAGLGYRYELFDGNTGPVPGSAPPVFDPDQNGYDSNFADAVAAFEYRNLFFDGAMEWTHTGSFAFPINDTSAWLGRTEAIIGIPLTAAWSFRTAFLFEYNNNAPDDQNKALTRTTVGLGYKF